MYNKIINTSPKHPSYQMGKLVSFLCTLWTYLMVPLSAQDIQIPLDAWENPSIFEVNRMPPRSAVWPHPDAVSAGAKPGHQQGSPWLQNLSGEWRFNWAPHPNGQPVGFQAPGFNDSQWKYISVPSCVELYGYGTPLYVNSIYPFKVDPPRVMGEPPKDWTAYKERNPISSYRRWIEIPANWTGQRIYLHVGAAGGCLSVWINGKTVGYSEDSRLAAEFDITEFVHKGKNLMAIQVLRNSDGSYLEDQDIWRLSGIFRDVFIFCRPSVHLWDVAVESDMDSEYRDAVIQLRGQIMNDGDKAAGPSSIRLTLRDPQGIPVTGFEVIAPVLDGLPAGVTKDFLSPSAILHSPEKWSFDRPALYTAVIELISNGRAVETVAIRIGFRKIALIGGQFTLNGKPVKLRGVNRHDWHPVTGYVVDEASMREDIRRIKQANLNAVRASHYPNDPRFVEMCDEIGLMLLAEANIESHGLSYHKCVLPGDLPEWEACTVERMRRLVIRDRSHPSIVMWSLGNEAGYGTAIEKAAAITRQLDAEKRPIQYADMNAPCDVDSQTYPSPDWLLEHVNGKATRKGERGEISNQRQHGKYPSGKPFLMNEYVWGGGSNFGNFQEYWDVIESHPMLIGGFIWDWADKGLATVEVAGKNKPILSLQNPLSRPFFYAYGGIYDDKPNDGSFALNGLLESDRTPKPHYATVAQVNRPIRVYPVDSKSGAIRLENRNFDLNLSEFVGTWEWTEGGRPVASGKLPAIDCAPGASVKTSIAPPSRLGSDRCLTIRFALAKATLWAEAGFSVGWDQLFIEKKPILPEVKLQSGKYMVQETTENVSLSGREFTMKIGKKSGMIEQLAYGSRELLVNPFRMTFWRPPTTNDLGWKMPMVLKPWKSAGDNAKVVHIKTTQQADGLTIVSAKIAIPVEDSHADITYTIDTVGTILVRGIVTVKAKSPADEVARIGLQAGIISSLDCVEWHGLGPDETYSDRKASGLLGIWSAKARKWNHNYLPPQETGHRSEVRFANITDATGMGFRVGADRDVFGLNLWPWTSADLEKIKYPHQLQQRDFLVLVLDSFQMGLGGTYGWGGRPLTPYRLKTGRSYEFGFVLQPKTINSVNN